MKLLAKKRINEFILDFRKSSFFKEILSEKEVIAILLLGSQSVGVTDERSDYDLAILIPDGQYEDIGQLRYLKYREKKVHWYFTPVTNWYERQNNGVLIYLCPLQIYNLQDAFVIYKNPKWSKEFDFILAQKKRIGQIAAYRLFDHYRGLITSILESQEITIEQRTKFLYHLCIASYYLLEDDLEIDKLKQIKRMRWQEIDQESIELILNRLKVFKEHMDWLQPDIDKEIQSFYEDWNLILEGNNVR